MALEGFVGLPHTHVYSFLNFIYLLLIFLAVLGLHCCVWASSNCSA